MKKKFMYHSTNKKNKDNIIKNGLKINYSGGFTKSGSWSYKVYGGIPVFLSTEKNIFYDKDSITFKVDVSGLSLLADLPSLIDLGGYLDEDLTIWWESGNVPEELEYLMDNNEGISAYNIIEDKYLNNAAIKATKTAAVMESIPAERIYITENNELDKFAILIRNIDKDFSLYKKRKILIKSFYTLVKEQITKLSSNSLKLILFNKQ